MHKGSLGDRSVHTALAAASYYGHIDIVNLLLESDARIEEDALEAACEGGDLDIVRLLFERQPEHNIDLLHQALQAACDNGNTDITHFLLGKSAAIAGRIKREPASTMVDHYGPHPVKATLTWFTSYSKRMLMSTIAIQIVAAH
jgi:ankyrin repeat protein